MESPVRWSLKVSKETDDALRAHLGRAGDRKAGCRRLADRRRRFSTHGASDAFNW